MRGNPEGFGGCALAGRDSERGDGADISGLLRFANVRVGLG